MRVTIWALLAALLVPSLAAVSPAAAHPAPMRCDTVLADTVIAGDLVVPERSHCELNGVTVLGDVRMHNGAGFAPYDSRIEGSITGAQFELLHLLNTTVRGGIRLRGGVRVEVDGATVAGDIRLNDIYDAWVLQSEVRGTLVVRGSGSQVRFCGTSVGQDARFADNSGWVMVGGDLATCAANEVRGTLRVHHNRQEITIANNTVRRDLICAANDPAPTVYGNRVSGRVRGQCGGNEPVGGPGLGGAE